MSFTGGKESERQEVLASKSLEAFFDDIITNLRDKMTNSSGKRASYTQTQQAIHLG